MTNMTPTTQATAMAMQAPLEAEPAPQVDPMLAMIERVASSPDLPIERLERLLDMQERVAAQNARAEFARAKAAAQAAMAPVLRKAQNTQTRSTYARLDDIARTIGPVISEHGFAPTFSQGEAPSPDYVRICCELMHSGGHSEQYHMDVPVDGAGMKGMQNKTRTHAYGSTMTYGRRYLTLSIWDIATTDDDDGNAAGSGTITAEQFIELRDLMIASEANEDAFLSYLGVTSLDALPAAKFARARQALLQKKQHVASGRKAVS